MERLPHNEYNYNTVGLKAAIKNGQASPKPTSPKPRGNGTTTVFPLGLPLVTRDRLANLSTQTGEPMAEIIRQAIDKILDEGVYGVDRVSSKAAERRTCLSAVRATVAQERAHRASAREQAKQERLLMEAHQAADKAAKKAIKTQPDPQPEPEPDSVTVETLDRPAAPSPDYVWVQGGTNRWGGYWRAPRGYKTAISGREPGSDDDVNN